MTTIRLNGLEDTARLGRLLAEMLVLRPSDVLEPTFGSGGLVLGLCGTLGAGKTNLVQALISALGVPREAITSPTFSLIQTYSVPAGWGSRENLGGVKQVDWTVHHVDAYRIADDDEFLELGIEELIEQPATLTLIEWAGKVENCLPAETLWVEIEYISDSSRQISFSSPDARWSEFVSDLGSRFAALPPP